MSWLTYIIQDMYFDYIIAENGFTQISGIKFKIRFYILCYIVQHMQKDSKTLLPNCSRISFWRSNFSILSLTSTRRFWTWITTYDEGLKSLSYITFFIQWKYTRYFVFICVYQLCLDGILQNLKSKMGYESWMNICTTHILLRVHVNTSRHHVENHCFINLHALPPLM